MPKETVSFTTVDGVTIVGDHYGAGPGPAALLLHMMPMTKESWTATAEQLLGAGFAQVLAIDLRGHGASTRGTDGEMLDYRRFKDEDHRRYIRDVEAAVGWLQGHGVDPSRLALAGASIGANIAIAYAADHPEIPAVAAVSAGADYHGVTLEDKVVRFAPGQALLLLASDDDAYSFATHRALAKLRPDATVEEFTGIGHGTRMFDKEPRSRDILVAWLREHVR